MALMTEPSESKNSGYDPSSAANCGHYDHLSSDVKYCQLASEIMDPSSTAVSPTINSVLQQSATIELFQSSTNHVFLIVQWKACLLSPTREIVRYRVLSGTPFQHFYFLLALLFISQYFAIPSSFIVTYHHAQTSRIHSRSFIGIAPCVLKHLPTSINSHSRSFAFCSTWSNSMLILPLTCFPGSRLILYCFSE